MGKGNVPTPLPRKVPKIGPDLHSKAEPKLHLFCVPLYLAQASCPAPPRDVSGSICFSVRDIRYCWINYFSGCPLTLNSAFRQEIVLRLVPVEPLPVIKALWLSPMPFKICISLETESHDLLESIFWKSPEWNYQVISHETFKRKQNKPTQH